MAARAQSQHGIELHAPTETKITAVSIYSTMAQVTRSFLTGLKEGQNKINVRGLPRALQVDSLRVEGGRKFSIHDVTISKGRDSDYLHLEEVKKSLESARCSHASLDSFMRTYNSKDYTITQLADVFEEYQILSHKLNSRILDLEKEVIDMEQEAVKGPSWDVSINVHGNEDEEAEILLSYAVDSAEWIPAYDVRVNTQAKAGDETVIVIYKAMIRQNTGEAWENVPLTLETTRPSFSLQPPEHVVWRIGEAFHMQSQEDALNDTSDMVEALEDVQVSDRASINATFKVSGLISILSDESKHSITIARIPFYVELCWYTVPKVDARVYVKGILYNDSEYIFIAGKVNVYMDESFSGNVQMPFLYPKESFECHFGLDPSLRVFYHPREKEVTTTGWFKKTEIETVTQRITILNTKSVAVENVRVFENFPVVVPWESATVQVKNLNPPLAPTVGRTPIDPVFVSENVTAEWVTTTVGDGFFHGQPAEGRGGRFNWLVSIPFQRSVSLILKYDVSHPAGYHVLNLE